MEGSLQGAMKWHLKSVSFSGVAISMNSTSLKSTVCSTRLKSLSSSAVARLGFGVVLRRHRRGCECRGAYRHGWTPSNGSRAMDPKPLKMTRHSLFARRAHAMSTPPSFPAEGQQSQQTMAGTPNVPTGSFPMPAGAVPPHPAIPIPPPFLPPGQATSYGTNAALHPRRE